MIRKSVSGFGISAPPALPADRERLTEPPHHQLARFYQRMNKDSQLNGSGDRSDTRPILIVPYMWIGDFVRNHTVVRVLKERWPNRPVDLLTTSLCTPLVDYMPGV